MVGSSIRPSKKLPALPPDRKIEPMSTGEGEWPLDPAAEAFEVLAMTRFNLSSRITAKFSGLIHPVHSHGRVFAWGLLSKKEMSEVRL